MRDRNTRVEFMTLLAFLMAAALVLSNGFISRIHGEEEDVYQQIEPLGVVLDLVQKQYVRDVDLSQLVEGALYGVMNALDDHSSFLSQEDLEAMQEDTAGQFEGIGVSIKLDERERIMVFQPIPGSPAAEAGIRPFDIIAKIDDVITAGMSLSDAADRIRGPRGTTVRLTILRLEKDAEEPEVLEFDVRRERVPLASIKESRLLEGGIGYVRISDFKQNTARDLEKDIKDFLARGMTALVLDLRWNPGGLLTASKEVCELFLPRGTLVTYTKGRPRTGSKNPDDLELFTSGRPIVPEDLPIIILVNEQTASSSEIVTGALQYYERAIIVGQKTFGKGSVQTIIPLDRPGNTALRLTTALYYTPGDVTIDGQGIQPDVEATMDWEQQRALALQLYHSYEDDPDRINLQNHGSVTGDEVTDETIEDVQLKRAVEILRESAVWDELLHRYHRDVAETQMSAAAAAAREQLLNGGAEDAAALEAKTEVEPGMDNEPETEPETESADEHTGADDVAPEPATAP